MGAMANYNKEVLQMKKKKNKVKSKSIGIFITIVILTIVINIPIYLHLTWHFIAEIGNYLSDNIPFLYIKTPIIFLDGIPKSFAIDLMLNIFLLLMIEFSIVYAFRKRLNKIIGIEDLFTMKKLFFIVIITIGLQMIISCWLWLI